MSEIQQCESGTTTVIKSVECTTIIESYRGPPGGTLGVLIIQGGWDASTNTPTLANGDAYDANDVFWVSVAGTVDFGNGDIVFALGDWAIKYQNIWGRIPASNAVVSVFTRTGIVAAEVGDYAAFYYTQAQVDAADAVVQGNLDTHEAVVTGNPHVVAHSQLADKGTNDHTAIDAHLADVTGNPHVVTAAQALAVALAGDTMTGLLILSGDPAVALGATPKQYVDNIANILAGNLANHLTDFANPHAVTVTDVGAVAIAGDTMTGLLILSGDPAVPLGTATKQYADVIASNAASNLYVHTDDSTNPHTVTKTQISLGNVDNTSDVNKPVSTAGQTALDLKEDLANKGAVSGYCPLGADQLVPNANLPTSNNLKGGWDASLNVPDIGAGVPYNDGDYWLVTVQGSTDLNGITTWLVGDWAIYDSSVGGDWVRSPQGALITSVFTRTGAIVADVSDYAAHYAALVHTHLEADVTDLDKYTEAQVDGFVNALSAAITNHENNQANSHLVAHSQLADGGVNAHSVIDTHVDSTSNPHAVDSTDVDAVSKQGDNIEAGNLLLDAGVMLQLSQLSALQCKEVGGISRTVVEIDTSDEVNVGGSVNDMNLIGTGILCQTDFVMDTGLTLRSGEIPVHPDDVVNRLYADAVATLITDHLADLDNPHQYDKLTYTGIKTTNYQAVVGDLVLADASGGTIDIDAPVSPSANDTFGVKLVDDGLLTVSDSAIESRITREIVTSALMWGGGETITWKYDGTNWLVESEACTSLYREMWSATATIDIGGVGSPHRVDWTHVPLFTGQVAKLFDETAGVLTYDLAIDRTIEVTLDALMSFDADSGDSGTFTLGMERIVGTGVIYFVPISDSFQSDKTGDFPVSGSAMGRVTAVVGDSYEIVAEQTEDTSGMVIELLEAQLVFSVG